MGCGGWVPGCAGKVPVGVGFSRTGGLEGEAGGRPEVFQR